MRVALFASGNGSNAQVIMDAAGTRDLPASVAVCITNNARAGVIDRAARADVAIEVVSDPADAENLIRLLRQYDVDVIALAGYLQHIPAEIIALYRHRILNVHPALLPSFGGKGMYGMNVHRAVIEAGVRWSGATVHFVDEQYDTGPIIVQSPVPVYQDDTPEMLARRVLGAEHHLYPIALRLLAQGRLHVEGHRVFVSDATGDKSNYAHRDR